MGSAPASEAGDCRFESGLPDMEAITEFQGEHRWLSNFWPAEVMLEGMTYRSVEHAYQAAKTLNLQDREKIRAMAHPRDVKKFSHSLERRPDWSRARVVIMADLLLQKFRQPELRQRLLETGDAELIEGNTWGDTFWGVCRGQGKNVLGRLLMAVRAAVRSGN